MTPPRAGWRRARRVLLAPSACLACAAFVVVWQPLFAYDALARAFPRFLWRVPTRAPLVAIVILHDGIADPSRGTAALPGILEAGRRKGLRFVSVGTLVRS